MKDIFAKKEEIKKRISLILVVFAIAGLFAFLVFFPYNFQLLRTLKGAATSVEKNLVAAGFSLRSSAGSLIEALRGGAKQESDVQYYYEYPEEVEFVLERKLNVEALDSQVEEYAITVTYPKDIPGIQDIVGVEMSREPDGGYPILDGGNFEFLKWKGYNFKGEDSITLTYHIKTKTYQWDITSEDSGTVEDIPEELKAQYLKDQWSAQDEVDFRIAPTNERIKNLAFEITKDKTTVFDKTKAIYDFIVNNITYSTSKTEEMPKSALITLEDRQGDCDDQAILFVSLCRAVGIPARLEAGVVFDPTKEEWGDHVWAQVYIPQKNGQGVFADIDTTAKNFLFRDPFRFTDFVDTGSSDDLDLYYSPFTGTYFELGNEPEFSQSYTTLNFLERGKIRKIVKID